MANPIYPPLFEKIARKNTIQRALDITILFLVLSLIAYRLLHHNSHGFTWLVSFLCESWFTFIWVIIISTKWSPVEYKTYPERLVERVSELPPVDIFVTTTDPVLEPPILTINTVISLLAVDYPAQKLACYVSDDGCSPLTFYSLVEASKFAKLWVPFCKKYNIQVRAPFRYFSGESISPHAIANSWEFQPEWKNIKDEYEKLSKNIVAASQKSIPCDLRGEFAVFSNIERRNHPTIIKVIWENKESLSDGLPHLVYISREKRPKHPHHHKGGAMNALTKVSGLMTNAPFMLNVDCDMYANNPQIVLHAMSLLLGSMKEKDSAFVHFPQQFYDGPKDDPFGNQLVVMLEYLGRGIAGIQGPFYMGTGCFHRRKVIYGLWPDDEKNEGSNHTSINGKLADEDLLMKFGNSKELIKSASDALKGRTYYPSDLSNSIEAAYHVTGCGYEYGTSWGTKVGWVYGSTTEDIHTGLGIHTRGWRSAYCSPDPPAFLGCAPSSGHASLTQQKRWATGLLEILFGKNSPILGTPTAKLQFRQCLAYMWVLTWSLRSIPELCYVALPAYCIITNSYFMPKTNHMKIVIMEAWWATYPTVIGDEEVFNTTGIYPLALENFSIGDSFITHRSIITSTHPHVARIYSGPVHEPAIYIPVALFVIYHLYTLSEYLRTGLSIRAWWNNQRMARITTMSAWLFGVFNVMLKLSGLSETVFQVTKKDQSTSSDGGDDADVGRFTFDESPIFVPGTTILLVQLTALVLGLLGLQPPPAHGGHGSGLGEVMCSVWVVICFWPFLKGLFGKGKYGIPLS